jgi:thiol-disulfide isomerase/thioredoxin
MKTTYLNLRSLAAIPILAIALLFASCAAEVEPFAYITGEISNPDGENVSYRTGDGNWETILEDGKFSLEIPMEEAAKGQIKIGPEYATMYLQPGDNVHISLDATEFDETIKYDGSAASQYLADKLMAGEMILPDAEANPFTFELDAFKEYANDLKAGEKALLATSKLPKTFASQETTDIDMNWMLNMAKYPEYHSYYAGKPDFTVSADYWDFVADVDMNDPANAESKKFMDFANMYLASKGAASVDQNASDTDKSMAKMDLIDNSFTDDAVKQKLYETSITQYIRNYGADGAEPLYQRFMSACDDEECVTRVTKLYDDWKKLIAGSPAPTFKYQNIEGQLVGLDDMKGKVVYIDVWATWCAPCKKEIPYLEEMQHAMADRSDIVFASISVDEDKAAWEKMVTEKEMMGVQLHAEGAFKSTICEDYRINGIPRFIIINKDGTVANANAPRPSSGDKIKKELEQAATQEVAML